MILSIRQIHALRSSPHFTLTYLKTLFYHGLDVYEPTTSWDPAQIIGQIICLQVAHYLVLACISVPFLILFSDWDSLHKDGGALCVAMLLDWHEWKSDSDWRRGWILGASWLLTTIADTRVLSFIVRRPILLLDHGTTLYILHFIFTIYYSKSIPQSFIWWIVMIAGAAATIILAEKICIDREMSTSLAFGQKLGPVRKQASEDIEMGSRAKVDRREETTFVEVVD